MESSTPPYANTGLLCRCSDNCYFGSITLFSRKLPHGDVDNTIAYPVYRLPLYRADNSPKMAKARTSIHGRIPSDDIGLLTSTWCYSALYSDGPCPFTAESPTARVKSRCGLHCQASGPTFTSNARCASIREESRKLASRLECIISNGLSEHR